MAVGPGPIPPSPVSNSFEWRDWFTKLGSTIVSGVGTVSSFAFNNANGFTGVVSNATTTPTLTLTGGGGDPRTNGVVIAVIGDSHAAMNQLMPTPWPAILEQEMNAKGCKVKVYNCAIDGMSFYRALNPPNSNFQFGTNNAVQQAIAYQPDIVLVELGGNDTWVNVDGRSTGQVEGDASAVFSALHTALPHATIAYVSEVWYDHVNAVSFPTTFQNQHSIPYFWNLTTTSPTICQGSYCSEALGNTASASVITQATAWNSLDTYIKGLTPSQGVTTWFKEDYWRVARMGGDISDLIHPNIAGRYLQCGYIMQGLKTSPFSSYFPNLQTNNQTDWEDPDALFNVMFTNLFGVWTENYASDSEAVVYAHNHVLDSPIWYLPYRTRVVLNLLSGNTVQDQFIWKMQNAPPTALVYVSTGNSTAFTSTGTTTDSGGNATAIESGSNLSTGLGGTGTYNIRYKMSGLNGLSIIVGPFAVVISNTQPSWTNVTGGIGYSNSWVDYGNPYYTVSYQLDVLGWVCLRGVMKSGTVGATAFTLPSGMHPSKSMAFSDVSNALFGLILIDSSGNVQLASGSNASCTLDGIRFYPG